MFGYGCWVDKVLRGWVWEIKRKKDVVKRLLIVVCFIKKKLFDELGYDIFNLVIDD